MIRKTISPRANWQSTVAEQGLVWHTKPEETGAGPVPHAQPNVPAQTYWDESVYYEFNMEQITQIEEATSACYEMYLEAGEEMLADRTGFEDVLRKLMGDKNITLLKAWGIPDYCHGLIREMWEEEPPCLNYGRFDFKYDGLNPPKLFEFNCDTPTSLLEASVIQWFWKEDQIAAGVFDKNTDQYNSLHEKLLAKFKDIRGSLHNNMIHFTNAIDEPGEDQITVAYLRDIAAEAGLETKHLDINDIGWDSAIKAFVDNDMEIMHTIYKLYPWEWMMHEAFGKMVVESGNKTKWIEPIWKMLFSNKGILPLLPAMFPESPFLLQASYSPLEGMDYVKKPILSREGANIEIIRQSIMGQTQTIAKTGGEYGEEGYIYQEYTPLPGIDGQNPVIGAWVVDGAPAGMGIREAGRITNNVARFVPHIIRG